MIYLLPQAGEAVGAGGLPLPPRQRLQAQYAARQRQRQQQPQAQAEGAEGGGGLEGVAGQPLDIQASLNELVGMLQRVLDFIPVGRDSDGYDSNATDSDDTH